MNSQSHAARAPEAIQPDPMQAAKTLGNLLRQTPEYETFLKALKVVNTDLTIQKLSAELRAHKAALQWGRDADGQHAIELTRLELELGDLPAMQEFHKAEKEFGDLLRAVDAIVSEAAGVAFAVNAQRTGCCG